MTLDEPLETATLMLFTLKFNLVVEPFVTVAFVTKAS